MPKATQLVVQKLYLNLRGSSAKATLLKGKHAPPHVQAHPGRQIRCQQVRQTGLLGSLSGVFLLQSDWNTLSELSLAASNCQAGQEAMSMAFRG